ncbi:GPR1/FUN34/yaaH family-domain-containing protein [Phialemonium atrogriseum]|uniref:GPR1/FUN34/yaaH family-domain-containing protein n=1 Tax=Phialemonium atrogriseum TaxID=1093897 RepID=A0AAJ0C102_9PEZI|nr:GPR1/FUN34/yaaH family-domain-containing protein [Phialemonium atrogriseum]KAK1767911.1 GPR1/FUN34/yaaH family-domain-containing protein [Phialemonium atrogriseum]
MSCTKKDEEVAEMRIEAYPRMEQRIGNPTPLAMGGFATTLLTLSLAMMGFRGVSVQTIFVGDLCFVACIGLLISAQWEMVKGNTFGYTVLSAFGLFYGGYGATLIPGFGIIEAYGGLTPEYYNALGFFVLIWAVLNIFFIIASLAFNFVYILIFITLELCLSLDAASYFALADGKQGTSVALLKAAGVFGFISSLLGYYCVAHYLCQDVLPFNVLMGDTSSFFRRQRAKRM